MGNEQGPEKQGSGISKIFFISTIFPFETMTTDAILLRTHFLCCTINFFCLTHRSSLKPPCLELGLE